MGSNQLKNAKNDPKSQIKEIDQNDENSAEKALLTPEIIKKFKFRVKIYKISLRLYNFFSFQFFVNFLIAVEMDLLLGAFIGIKHGSISSFAHILSLTVSILIVLAYGALVFFIAKKLHKIGKNNIILAQEINDQAIGRKNLKHNKNGAK